MKRRWHRPRLRLADWFEIQLVKTGVSPWELCAEIAEAYGHHIDVAKCRYRAIPDKSPAKPLTS